MSYYGNELRDLCGKTVKAVELNADKTFLVFVLDDGGVSAWSTEGDCCSNSWIEHINGVDTLLGRKVNNIVDREMPNVDTADEYECIQCYGWTIETDGGRCDIEMRNSSNGYYGGWLQKQEMNNIQDQYHSPTNEPAPTRQLVTADF